MSGRAQSSRGARTLATDLHVHADASYGCEMLVETMLARAAVVGPNTVAITDHDSAGALPRAFDITHEYGVWVVPGVEVSTTDGHLLTLGVDDPPATRQPLSETAREVREVGEPTVVPHPFRTFRHGASRRAIRDIGAIEVYSAHTLTGFRNGQARRCARRQELPGTGGSDTHRPALVGQAYTVVSVETDGGVTTGTILEGIHAGRTVARGTRATAHRYLRKCALSARLKTASFL